MSAYKFYLHHYAPGSHSTHHHYYAARSHTDRTRNPTSPTPRAPNTSPSPSASTDPHPQPSSHDQARAYTGILEERAPGRYTLLDEQLVDPRERRSGRAVRLPRWFWDAGRGAGRRRAGGRADAVHGCMARDCGERRGRDGRFGRGRGRGAGGYGDRRWEWEWEWECYARGCELGWGLYGADGERCARRDRGVQRDYDSGTDTEADTDSGLRACARRRVVSAQSREARGRHVGVGFQLGREMGSDAESEMHEWHRSTSRQCAEYLALQKFIEALQPREKQREHIRLRSGEKAWVRPKKTKSKVARRYHGLGGRGEVNDVDWRDVEWVHEGRTRRERQVRWL